MANTKTAPTLDDVAKQAGVSTATVSRCLNGSGKVNAVTRERVMTAVDALGYTPNFAARVMAARRTHTIGAIIPTMDNAIFARGLQAFQEELESLGYNLLVSSSAYDPEIEHKQIRSLVARGADGLLLIGHDRDLAVYDYLDGQNVPTLAAWSYIDGARLPSIGFDNARAMHALTREVIDMGHRRLAMISGVTRGNDRARLRLEGFRSAVAEAGLKAAEVPVVQARYGIEEGMAAFDEIMRSGYVPSAVLCGNDVLAVGAQRAAQRMGLNVPHDVSITGFDDIELARIVDPPLTTVHVPHREMGRKAARELVRMVEGAEEGSSELLATEIARRGSLLGRCSQ